MTALPYDDTVEQIQEDEARLTQEIVARMAAAQARNAERHRHAHRDAHAKSHAILKGTLAVHANLPPELAQGLFSQPREYEVVARLSSAPGDIHSDEAPAPRGFAIKVMGVQGDRLLPGLGGHNQDFLMVNFPVLAFGTVQDYPRFLTLLEANADAPQALQRAVAAAARGIENVVERLGGTPGATVQGLAQKNTNMLGETYHTQAAIRFGNYVAKLSLAPWGGLQGLNEQPIGEGFSAMRDALTSHFAKQGATYELRAQLQTDRTAMPVEDASVLWDEKASPHRAIATLRFDIQNPYSPERQVYGDDHLAFNPWNGVAAHRPLGSIMRVRRPAYESSTAQRHRLNALPRREPASLADVPD